MTAAVSPCDPLFAVSGQMFVAMKNQADSSTPAPGQEAVGILHSQKILVSNSDILQQTRNQRFLRRFKREWVMVDQSHQEVILSLRLSQN